MLTDITRFDKALIESMRGTFVYEELLEENLKIRSAQTQALARGMKATENIMSRCLKEGEIIGPEAQQAIRDRIAELLEICERKNHENLVND